MPSASATLRPNGYAGPLGYASAGVMADYVLVDMFAEAVTGQASTEDAIANAAKRADRYYCVNPARRRAASPAGALRRRRHDRMPSTASGGAASSDASPRAATASASCSCCRRRCSCSAF